MDIIKQTNILYIEPQKRKKKKLKGAKNLFEDIKTPNFPNLGKEMDTQI